MCALVYDANSPAVFVWLSCQIKSNPIHSCKELTSSLVCLNYKVKQSKVKLEAVTERTGRTKKLILTSDR